MTREVMFRLPPELVARADARARQMTQETGLRATRTDVARLALVAYLEEAEPPAVAPIAEARTRRDDVEDIDASPDPFDTQK